VGGNRFAIRASNSRRKLQKNAFLNGQTCHFHHQVELCGFSPSTCPVFLVLWCQASSATHKIRPSGLFSACKRAYWCIGPPHRPLYQLGTCLRPFLSLRAFFFWERKFFPENQGTLICFFHLVLNTGPSGPFLVTFFIRGLSQKKPLCLFFARPTSIPFLPAA